MKRFGLLSIFLSLLAAVNMTAGVKLTLNIARPAAVTVSINDVQQSVTAGANVFDVEDYSNLNVSVVEPYIITNVTNSSGTPVTWGASQSWYLYVTPDSGEEQEYTINVKNLDDARTGKFIINVDDASNVEAMMSGYGAVLSLVNGENVIKFDPDVETSVSFRSTAYDMPLYKVTVDGIDVAGSYGTFVAEVYEDCKVDVQALYPDVDVTITFKYNEDGFGAIKQVLVNDTPVENFNGYEVAVKMGSKVALVSNPDFKLEKVLENGENTWWTGGQRNFVAMKDLVYDITATKYGKFEVTLNITDPAALTFYYGYSYDGNVIEGLVAGENVLTISEGNSTISWEKNPGATIEEITLNGEPVQYGNNVSMKEGDVLSVTATSAELDQTAYIVAKEIPEGITYFMLRNADNESYNLAQGENTIVFATTMNPFQLGWTCELRDPVTYVPLIEGVVTLNGVAVEPAYPGSTMYALNLKDGDVVEIVFSETSGVDSIEAAEGDAVLYDLNGRRVNGNAKGIVIRNGKKVIVK